MARGGKSRGGQTKSRTVSTRPQGGFNYGTPGPFTNPTSEGESNEWTDHYFHPTRSTFDCPGCDKTYSAYHHLTAHERVCFPKKRSLNCLLQESKAFWEARKRRRLEELQSREGSSGSTSEQSDQRPDLPATPITNLEAHHTPADGVATGPQDGSGTGALGTPASSGDIDAPIANRKNKRNRRLPARFRDTDTLPEPPAPHDASTCGDRSAIVGTEGVQQAPTIGGDDVSGEVLKARALSVFTAKRDAFGVARRYAFPVGTSLKYDPGRPLRLVGSKNAPELVQGAPVTHPARAYGPFSSKTAFHMADWYWSSTNKSFSDFQKLIDIMRTPGFSVDDVVNVNWNGLFKCLGSNKEDLSDYDGAWIDDDGWKTTPISIDVPFHNRMKSNRGTEQYTLGNLRHRSIVAVIKEKILNAQDSLEFHYYPYQATWKRDQVSPEVELYGEFYYSREFRNAHEELQRLALPGTDADLERVVVALMFWSDGTHLTSFGTASLWPCYLYFGNESKYRRCKPTERLGYHIAYFERLPDSFTDYLKERNNGKIPSDSLFAHCVREAYHSQWNILLDQELCDAMKYGIRLVCPDGKTRLFFPRIFTYSADYPEKVLVAGIRNNGISPCHRCFVEKKDLSRLGAPTDTERELPRSEPEAISAIFEARKEIFEGGYSVDTAKIEQRLKPLSLVPTLNSFHSVSTIQTGHPFTISDALVVDLMHEFEIGVWKRLYIHLIRLLDAFSTGDTTLSAELDSRYRTTPPFGRDTIRKFGVNASTMKRKAARDFEDLLQCAIPAFESLLPEPYNSILMKLLFICGQWHSLAKLRLHNDFTLECLEYTTTWLGAQMRHFDQEVSKVPTKELPKEADARARKEGKGKSKGGSSRKLATLSIFTIKFHFLGDYVSSIRKRGTADSYSTETGELAHRLPKSWYGRTDRKDFKHQMSQIERRQARLAQIRSTMGCPDFIPQSKGEPGDHREGSSLDCRYVVGASQNEPLDLSLFTQIPGSASLDKHLTDFLQKLQEHLLPRIAEKLGFPPESIPESDAACVSILDHRLFNHQILRLFYTTYDVRREEDVIHVDTSQCNVMVLNSNYAEATWDTEHPYMYAKVNGIFHANVAFVGRLPDGTRNYSPHRIDFAWVHWYQLCEPPREEFQLDRVSLAPIDHPAAIGFVDPADVMRAVHVIPRYSMGKFKGKPLVSRVVRNLNYWDEYYINRFSDRDLFMRFQLGMSVGHTYMHGRTFPPPSIPRIPTDFNHHLRPATVTTISQSESATPHEGSSPVVELHRPVVVPVYHEPIPTVSASLSGEAAASHLTVSPGDGGIEAMGSSTMDWGEDATNNEFGIEEVDAEDEEDYWDGFEDRELMHYSEMFGYHEDDDDQ